MTDREKTIKALECCATNRLRREDCEEMNCTYLEFEGNGCIHRLIRDALALLKAQELITGETSDGYHTFNELYHHRAVLFSVIVANYPDRAWKSKKHHDGTMYDGMFIVGIETPDGQATYHYDIDPYWDMFKCRVLDKAPEWDGHTPAQAIERIGKLKAQEPRVMTLEDFENNPNVDQYGCLPCWMEYREEPKWDGWAEATVHTCVEYGRRPWTSRPTDEQREAVKWE